MTDSAPPVIVPSPPAKNPAGCNGCRAVSKTIPRGTAYVCADCGTGRAEGPPPEEPAIAEVSS